jgi:SHS2 domain-containing protein
MKRGDPRGYRIIEHTADAGIEAFGATKEEAFARAAEGMYTLMLDPTRVREDHRMTVRVVAEDGVGLLERWLKELLFITDTSGMVFRRFEVTIRDNHLEAIAHGELLDVERHQPRGDIKGVTKHLTAIERLDGEYRVRVLFDM